MNDTRFEEIWDAEMLARGERASAECGMTAAERERGRKNLKTAKDKLYALIGSLSVDETRAYGDYRRKMLTSPE
jgi:hypothetical protein